MMSMKFAAWRRPVTDVSEMIIVDDVSMSQLGAKAVSFVKELTIAVC
jgi:hypothetical protein